MSPATMTYKLVLPLHQFNQKGSIIFILMFAVEISICSQAIVLAMSDLDLESTPSNNFFSKILVNLN